MRYFFLFLFLGFSLNSYAKNRFELEAIDSTKLQEVSKLSTIDSGCDWRKQLPFGPSFAYAASEDGEDPLWIKVYGKYLQLKFQVKSPKKDVAHAIGSTFNITYQGSEIKAVAYFKIIRVCLPAEDQCETTDYESSIVLTDQSGQTFKLGPIKLSCGS